MRRLEDVYVELGSYDTHIVVVMLSTNRVLIRCMMLYSRSGFVQGSKVAHNSEGAL